MKSIISILIGEGLNRDFNEKFDHSYYKKLDFRLNQKHINFTGLSHNSNDNFSFIHYAVDANKSESTLKSVISIDQWISGRLQVEYNQIFQIGTRFQSLSFVIYIAENSDETFELFKLLEQALAHFRQTNIPIGGIDFKLVFLNNSGSNDSFSVFKENFQLNYSSTIQIGNKNRNGLVINQDNFLHNFIIEFSWLVAISNIGIAGNDISLGFLIARIKPKWIEYIIDNKILELWQDHEDKELVSENILFEEYIQPLFEEEIKILHSQIDNQDLISRYKEKDSEFYKSINETLINTYKKYNLNAVNKALESFKNHLFLSNKTNIDFIESSPTFYALKNFTDLSEFKIPLRDDLLKKLLELKNKSKYSSKNKQQQINRIKSEIINRFNKKQDVISQLSKVELNKIKSTNNPSQTSDSEVKNKEHQKTPSGFCESLKSWFSKKQKNEPIKNPTSIVSSSQSNQINVGNLFSYLKNLMIIKENIYSLNSFDNLEKAFINLKKPKDKDIEDTHVAFFEINPIDEAALLKNVETFLNKEKNYLKYNIQEDVEIENLPLYLLNLRKIVIEKLNVRLDLKQYLDDDILNQRIHQRINNLYYICFNNQSFIGNQTIVYHPIYPNNAALNFIPQGANINQTDIHVSNLADASNMIYIFEWGWK